MTAYDIVMVEKPLEDGLKKEEIIKISGLLRGESFLPLEVIADFSAAMGYVSQDVAEACEYDMSVIEDYVIRVLNDVSLEESCEYVTPIGASLYIWRI